MLNVHIDENLFIKLPDNFVFSGDTNIIGKRVFSCANCSHKDSKQINLSNPFSEDECLVVSRRTKYSELDNFLRYNVEDNTINLFSEDVRNELVGFINMMFDSFLYNEFHLLANNERIIVAYGTNGGNDNLLAVVSGDFLYTGQV